MRKPVFIILSFMMVLQLAAQKGDKKLQRVLEAAVTGFHGNIGVYVKNLKNGRVVSIHADTVFPSASVVKVPILVGIMDKMNRGELGYHQSLTYKDSLLYEGEDILGSYKNNEKVELSKVLMLMLTTSDNTASLWLQSLAGKGTRINEIMDSLGLSNTRVNSRTPGREGDQKKYGWGQTTPREMALLFEKLVRGEVIGAEQSARMIRLLGRNYWDEEAISQIPADVFIASKNGAVNESRSEVMYVNGRGARYLFSVFTKNNKDQSWESSNEAWVLTRKLSKLVWDHFQ
jgi:beta-lactamase class A